MLAWIAELGDPWYPLTQPAPPGQSAYLASRLVALYALMLLWLQVLAGLLIHRLRLPQVRMELVIAWHVPQGLAVLAFAMLHPLLFWLGIGLRTGKTDWGHWLAPTFSNGYYQSMQSLGRLGLALLVLGTLGAALARRLGLRRSASWIHRLNLITFALALVHGASIGGETRSGLILSLLTVMAMTVAAGLVDRVKHALGTGDAAPGLSAQPAFQNPRRICRVLFLAEAFVLFVALVPVIANLAGAGSQAVSTIPSPELARSILDGPRVAVIDVREPEEFAEEHIPGATCFPVRNLDQVAPSLVSGAGRVVLYCLKDFRGFEGVRRIRRYVPRAELIDGYGLTRWKASGFPTTGELALPDDSAALDALRAQVAVAAAAPEPTSRPGTRR